MSTARVSLLMLYGERDALVQAQPAIARTKALNPKIQALLYAASGHAPFMEEADRFNTDLVAFVKSLR